MSNSNQTQAVDALANGHWLGHLDIAERVLAIALYGWLIARVMTVYLASGGAGNLIVLFSEGLIVFFILIRRGAKDVSRRPTDWLLALVATATPLLVQPVAQRGSFAASDCRWHDAGRDPDPAGCQTYARPQFRLGTRPSRPEALRTLSFRPPSNVRGLFALPHRFLVDELYRLERRGVCPVLCGTSAAHASGRALTSPRRAYAQYMSAVRFLLLPGVF